MQCEICRKPIFRKKIVWIDDYDFGFNEETQKWNKQKPTIDEDKTIYLIHKDDRTYKVCFDCWVNEKEQRE